MSKQRTLTDIPDDEVAEVVSDLESEGCTVQKKRQDNGSWTVIATCPDG